MPSNNSVFGIFKTRSAVEMAIDELMRAGFRNSDFSLLLPHTVGTRELAHEKSSKRPRAPSSAVGQVRCSAGRWVHSWAWASWSSRALGRSSQRGR